MRVYTKSYIHSWHSTLSGEFQSLKSSAVIHHSHPHPRHSTLCKVSSRSAHPLPHSPHLTLISLFSFSFSIIIILSHFFTISASHAFRLRQTSRVRNQDKPDSSPNPWQYLPDGTIHNSNTRTVQHGAFQPVASTSTRYYLRWFYLLPHPFGCPLLLLFHYLS